jgi:hypothetical protein
MLSLSEYKGSNSKCFGFKTNTSISNFLKQDPKLYFGFGSINFFINSK